MARPTATRVAHASPVVLAARPRLPDTPDTRLPVSAERRPPVTSVRVVVSGVVARVRPSRNTSDRPRL